jgi:predicted MFS family arabinose efflux permease
MLTKIILLVALGLVVWQLISALRALSRGQKGDPQRLMQALKRRVILSIIIVAALFVFGAMGYITPHSL